MANLQRRFKNVCQLDPAAPGGVLMADLVELEIYVPVRRSQLASGIAVRRRWPCVCAPMVVSLLLEQINSVPIT